MSANIAPERIRRAKRAFSTRRVDPAEMRCLIAGTLRPEPGDVVLARVDYLGKQKKIELTDGRRATMFPGDEIVVCYGNRYAPDQFEAEVGLDLSSCQLVAAGGVAANELGRNLRMLPATQITPIGLIGGANGRRLNLRNFRVEVDLRPPRIPVVLSLGTSMNAGKTLTSMSMVRGFKRHGLRVAALKATGTGSGGDLWIVRDAGADTVLDFTDAGFASTYLSPIPDLERAFARLLNAAEDDGCEIAVVEIADGLQQLETSQLIASAMVQSCCVGVTFAAYDAMGAICGVDVLRKHEHNILGLSGRLSLSHLAVREAETATRLRVYSPLELQEGALVPAVLAAIEQSGRALPITVQHRQAGCAMDPAVSVLSLNGAADAPRGDSRADAIGPSVHAAAECLNGSAAILSADIEPVQFSGGDEFDEGEEFDLDIEASRPADEPADTPLFSIERFGARAHHADVSVCSDENRDDGMNQLNRRASPEAR